MASSRNGQEDKRLMMMMMMMTIKMRMMMWMRIWMIMTMTTVVVDARESEGGVENDAAGRCLLHQLHQQGRQHPGSLTDEEHDGHDEEGARQASVVGLTLVRREVALRRRR